MVKSLKVEQISPESAAFQAELASLVGNRDRTIEAAEIADPDGYLDCKYFVTARQFLNWETRLFNAGLITRLREASACNSSPHMESIAYMNVERVNGKSRLFAYFSDRTIAATFMRDRSLSGNPRQVPANKVERAEFAPGDDLRIQSNEPLASEAANVNRPANSGGRIKAYYRVDITQSSKIPEGILTRVNTAGNMQANCFNFSLVASCAAVSLDHAMNPTEFEGYLETNYTRTTKENSGDLVYWHHDTRKGKLSVHAFVDMGGGWILTKNGQADRVPYRLQRRDVAYATYMKMVDDFWIANENATLKGKQDECASAISSRLGCTDFIPLTEERYVRKR